MGSELLNCLWKAFSLVYPLVSQRSSPLSVSQAPWCQNIRNTEIRKSWLIQLVTLKPLNKCQIWWLGLTLMVCGGQGSGRQIMNCSASQLPCIIHQWLHFSRKCTWICMTVPVMCMTLSSFFSSTEPRIPLSDVGRDCAGQKRNLGLHKPVLAENVCYCLLASRSACSSLKSCVLLRKWSHRYNVQKDFLKQGQSKRENM